MSLIYYLGYYDTYENKDEGRSHAPAASNKMTYIVSALERNGHTVEIVSPSMTQNNRFLKGKTVPIGERSRLKLFASFPYRPRVLRVLGRWLLKGQIVWYLLRRLKKDDVVMAYHSLALMNRIRLLKRFRKFRLLLEVEEIYGDVMQNAKVSQKELDFFRIADGYLFPARRLGEKVNTENKPQALIHGTYECEKLSAESFSDDKIHCVYAGTLDPRKGGAANAVKAARFLPANYHVHILGNGSEIQVKEIRELVDRIKQVSACGISYDGCRHGEEFSAFLQKCQIGLSTQNPDGCYNDTSFPSKILTYMANGLQVVTVRIPVVEESAVHDKMHYYDDPQPEKIAAAIQAAAAGEEKDTRSVLEALDLQFRQDMKGIMEEI